VAERAWMRRVARASSDVMAVAAVGAQEVQEVPEVQ